ncbi:NAD(P)-dependent oxidoreductase [Vibrio sp. 10N.286.49.B3]|uniref:SDR family oxidoreductase n=1 Tax=Vibrio sp. 10N.286.49.B3 TaxID=1880855 RepID=UPI000C863A60|nr:SDR family oxidoreductase [Vibrio sp. 10N.286.49.B3]PMH44879.1 NAD(P)-dependent oxidoreductase [Vibrio sp. 10N.286.49.B3]
MKIAVTAASGQLGHAIIQALLELVPRQNIIALARSPEKITDLDVEIRPGDYDQPNQLESSLTDIDTLLLVSGMTDPRDRIQQHRNVINAAKKMGVNKIVYTSIQGAENGNAFSPIVQSNRLTEQDVTNSGLKWVIGRNGIYIEPDVEYIDSYKKLGTISNCAGDGKCGYTTRGELAYAYAKMLIEEKHNGKCYNLHGTAISQQQLTHFLNLAFNTELTYKAISNNEFLADRTAELGEFIGTVITGIYQGINAGYVDNESHFKEASGRNHISWAEYFNL